MDEDQMIKELAKLLHAHINKWIEENKEEWLHEEGEEGIISNMEQAILDFEMPDFVPAVLTVPSIGPNLTLDEENPIEYYMEEALMNGIGCASYDTKANYTVEDIESFIRSGITYLQEDPNSGRYLHTDEEEEETEEE